MAAFAAAFPVSGLSDRHCRLRRFEASGVVYERLSVLWLRQFVVGGDFGALV